MIDMSVRLPVALSSWLFLGCHRCAALWDTCSGSVSNLHVSLCRTLPGAWGLCLLFVSLGTTEELRLERHLEGPGVCGAEDLGPCVRLDGCGPNHGTRAVNWHPRGVRVPNVLAGAPGRGTDGRCELLLIFERPPVGEMLLLPASNDRFWDCGEEETWLECPRHDSSSLCFAFHRHLGPATVHVGNGTSLTIFARQRPAAKIGFKLGGERFWFQA